MILERIYCSHTAASEKRSVLRSYWRQYHFEKKLRIYSKRTSSVSTLKWTCTLATLKPFLHVVLIQTKTKSCVLCISGFFLFLFHYFALYAGIILQSHSILLSRLAISYVDLSVIHAVLSEKKVFITSSLFFFVL